VVQICSILDDLLPGSPHVPHSSLIQFVADRLGHDRRYAIDARCPSGKREKRWTPRTGWWLWR
jgi:dTDP-glucose 4,6-dehydratase